ncbi:hypothetical protein F5B18DRAFT_454259 [Nemania serpens]|nr:hypothetical protein F5B18DRAFT_454259 [Nemania serpens]
MLRLARDRLIFRLSGLALVNAQIQIMSIWHEKMGAFLRVRKDAYYSMSKLNRDLDLPPGLVVERPYQAWSCTEDVTIDNGMPSYTRYTIPDGSLPPNSSSPSEKVFPPHLYKRYGAELVSSVLDYDNLRTRLMLRRVCKTLRDELRIHKRIPQIQAGVHIHTGQQAGWTLLHLKKFATLWHLIEPSLYKGTSDRPRR